MAEPHPYPLNTPQRSGKPHSPRSAAAILADLQALSREDDRLELRLALVAQSLKAAEARADTEDVLHYLDRAQTQLRRVG